MKLRLTVLSCLVMTLCAVFLSAETNLPGEEPAFSFASLYAQTQSKIKNLFSSTDQKAQELTRCAGLSLTDEEQTHFQAAYKTLADKQEWLTLVDPQNTLPKTYQPQDLITKREKNWPKPARLRPEAMQQMEAMIAAAEKDGVTLIPISTYRTWNYQKMLSDRKPGNPYVAMPGESQHHLGTAVDFNTVNPKDENIPALVWLRKHAGEYGFSLSFPKGKEAEEESGYPYEAWHYRYITREAVRLQDDFFSGSQHKMLNFLHACQPFSPVRHAE